MQKVIGEILVNYQVVGSGKKDMVVLHGWQASIEEWKRVADNFSEDGYRVFLIDLPGFGGTSRVQSDWGAYEYADFVVEFCKTMGVKNPVVIGHSFGGRVAIVLAGFKKIAISRLVLVDAAGMEMKSLKTRMVRVLAPWFRWLPKNIKRILGSADYKNSGNMMEIFKKVINQPLRYLLPEIKVPTVVVWGERDSILPLSEAKMIHKGILGSVFRIVWGAGHSPHVEKLDEFIQILKEEGI